MRYPTIEQYLHALQAPDVTILDPLLASGRVELSPMGLPLARLGGYALTFKISANERDFALRCLLAERPTFAERIWALSDIITSDPRLPLAPIRWLDRGLGLNGVDVPAICMDWVHGEPLGIHLERVHDDTDALASVRGELRRLATQLTDAGFAHGDLHPFNIVVEPDGGLRLIDYDGYYAGPTAHLGPLESGHGNFQHPRRYEAGLYGPNLDSFSFLALDTALACLMEDPDLWRFTSSGAEALVFRADDFADPGASRVVQRTRSLTDAGQRVGELEAMTRMDPQIGRAHV